MIRPRSILVLLLLMLAFTSATAEDAATQPNSSGPDADIAGPTVLIEPGSFIMGSPETEPARGVDETPHPVKITKPFYIGRHEVTVGQFKRFVADTGYKTTAEQDGSAWVWTSDGTHLTKDINWKNPGFDQTDSHPVVCISQTDALAYCKWLSAKLGQTCTLPTEAQWEYATRSADTSASGPGKLDDIAWHRGNSDMTTHPVETKKPNTWGLFDTHGNAMEWTLDPYTQYPTPAPDAKPIKDPAPTPDPKTKRPKTVSRGGSWSARDSDCRSASRSRFDPNSASNFSGFRIIILPE